MRHIGGQCNCALFSPLFRRRSVLHILGDAAFTGKPIDHQNGGRGTVVACDVRAARGHYLCPGFWCLPLPLSEVCIEGLVHFFTSFTHLLSPAEIVDVSETLSGVTL